MLEAIKDDLADLQKTTADFSKRIANISEINKSQFISTSSILLLLSKEKDSFALRSKPVEIKLNNPTFITSIEIGALFNSYGEFNLRYKSTYNNDIQSKTLSLYKDRTNIIIINDYVSELVFSSKKEITLSSMKVFGLNESISSIYNITLKNIYSTLNVSNDRLSRLINKISESIEELDSREIEIVEEREKLEKYKLSLEDEILKLEAKRDELSDSVADLENTFSEVNSALSDSNAQLKILRNEEDNSLERHRNLKQDIEKFQAESNELKGQIHSLENDKNIFSEDLSGYVKETRFQQFFYGAICSACIIIAIVLSVLIFDKALGIIDLLNSNIEVSVIDVIVSRMPFTLAVIATYTFLTAGVHLTLNRLVKIHDQRLVFLRLSILSRDIVEGVTNDLDLDDDEIIKERIKLKLKFIRSHLDKDISTQDLIKDIDGAK